MKEYFVGIGEAYVGYGTDIFIARALGSCVALAIYDPFLGIGGMAHILLPGRSPIKLHNPTPEDKKRIAKRAENAMDFLVSEIKHIAREQARGRKTVLRAKIAGGAEMFPRDPMSSLPPVGERNVQSILEGLKTRNILLKGSDTGGSRGRTAIFYLQTGKMTIRTIYGVELEI